MESATCCGMESERSDAWNQSEGAYTLRAMPYRRKATDSMHRASRGDSMPILGCSFGLDRKKHLRKQVLFSWLPLLDSNSAKLRIGYAFARGKAPLRGGIAPCSSLCSEQGVAMPPLQKKSQSKKHRFCGAFALAP